MRLVIARCSVDYIGRLTAHLPMAPRLLLVKADGSVSIHADDRAYKPLNWMSPPCTLRDELADGAGTWTVTNKAGEQLVITIESVEHDSSHELGVDPGLQKDGVEAELQRLLALHVETLGVGWSLVRREYPTAIGPVDLLCRDADGTTVAVEIKRRGEIDGVVIDLDGGHGQARPREHLGDAGTHGAQPHDADLVQFSSHAATPPRSGIGGSLSPPRARGPSGVTSG